MKEDSPVTFSDRLVGMVVALLFAVPTAFVIWLALNVGIASINLFVNSDILWIASPGALVIGFLAPDLLIDLLARAWHLLVNLVRWY